jgi:small-conductance mechanosensitive channel
MPASELQKNVAFFLISAALLIVTLLLFPTEAVITDYAALKFGLAPGTDGSWTAAEGVKLTGMEVTYLFVIVTIFSILRIILAMALVVVVVRFFGYLFTKTVYRKTSEGEISSLLKTVISVIIYIVAFFIIFQTIFPGIQLTALFTGSTIVGIVVGLALQDTLGNLFAGLALQADQSFQVGDVISLTAGMGVVESVSWRGVKIRTFQNKLIVLNNATLGKEPIEIAPKTNLNARLVFFNTVYSASPDRTIQLVREAVRTTENVSSKIRPIVRIRNLAADGIDWEIKYWLDDYTKHNDSDAAIRQRVWYVFQREKIDFAYPTRTVHIAEKQVEAEPEDVVNTIAEHLSRVSIFAPLSDEELEQLAKASTSRIYTRGESIVRKGREGKSMFVIIRGSVKVQVPEKSYMKTLGTLGPNDFFGEMSLLTGQPRTASVFAVEETEVLQIKKEGLKPIFEGNLDLVQAICELVEERSAALKSVHESAEPAAADNRRGVMESIRKFFGLKQPAA